MACADISPIKTEKDTITMRSEAESLCPLERLLETRDVDSLVALLYDRVWQRFSLSSENTSEFQSAQSRVQTGAANTDVQAPETPSGLNADNTSIGSKPELCMSVDSDTGNKLFDAGQSAKSKGEIEDCDDHGFASSICEAKIRKLDSKDEEIMHSFPSWFYLGAVFTGCPKLLQFLINPDELPFRKGHSNNDDASKARHSQTNAEGGHCHKAGKDVDALFRKLQSSSYDTKPSKPLKLNQSVEAPTRSSNNDVSRQAMNVKLVKVKVACEFPVTDTWIHKSVNLVVSPLHLACWRHDYNAVITLLRLGADPNELALEQVRDGGKASQEAPQCPYLCYDGLYFHSDRGLSPLHFVALGLRSPPRHSIFEGCKAGIIHDTGACCQQLWRSEASGHETSGHSVCKMLTPTGESCLDEADEQTARLELVVSCLEALLEAGAAPNVGQNLILEGAYPLDIVLQPPLKVYYAPSAARGNHSSVYLRMTDLEHNVRQVVAACEVLLRHDAKVSSTFVLNHLWRPELLDCFYLKDTQGSWQLVTYHIRLGIFTGKVLDHHNDLGNRVFPVINVRTSAVIQRFIADVVNRPVSASLTSLILGWCSMPLLHDVTRTILQIARTSGWNPKLKELADLALSAQLRSLKHCCSYTILKCVNFSCNAISCLPLPSQLKRELNHLYF